MTLRPRSLQAQLAWRLLLLFAAATMVGVALLAHQARQGGIAWTHRALLAQARDIAASVAANGTPPRDGANAPAMAAEAFALHSPAGLTATSSSEFSELAVAAITVGEEPRYVRLKKPGSPFDDYCVVRVRLATAAGPLAVTVGRPSNAGPGADALVDDFVADIAWTVPTLMALTLGTALFAVRRSLRPVQLALQQAGAIGPQATGVRLPEAGLPTEIAPLVQAVNQALGRLEQGFAVQRDFTAHAAHELRTPLAILTTGLEALHDEHGDVAALRADVARMNRLVEQLLAVARLDAAALDVQSPVDLHEVATDVVSNLAPWALARGRALSLEGDETRGARVPGNQDAIGSALRNLVDNALAHAPAGTEVRVQVGPGARVSVLDDGAGVPQAERAHVFERFWRSKTAPAGGAGLGLAIVRKIMEAHGGRVFVEDRASGGAVFTMEFPATPDRA